VLRETGKFQWYRVIDFSDKYRITFLFLFSVTVVLVGYLFVVRPILVEFHDNKTKGVNLIEELHQCVYSWKKLRKTVALGDVVSLKQFSIEKQLCRRTICCIDGLLKLIKSYGLQIQSLDSSSAELNSEGEIVILKLQGGFKQIFNVLKGIVAAGTISDITGLVIEKNADEKVLHARIDLIVHNALDKR